jgi:16S rRNA (cytidine1402-2'-O)-methyltransferase
MSKLYIIPTPIGNLEDITLRAIRILKEVDLILAEDTRHSIRLLKHYQIETKMQSFHQYNEHKILQGIVSRINSGEKIALISDAGTPGISDPGFILVRECIRNGLAVECLPGPTAFIPALINSGFASDRFHFEGFLPHKKGRKSRLEILSALQHTIIFYESPFRLVKTLEQFIEYFGTDRQASVSRELTKIYEETKRGNLSELLEYFRTKKVQGEIVIVVSGKP